MKLLGIFIKTSEEARQRAERLGHSLDRLDLLTSEKEEHQHKVSYPGALLGDFSKAHLANRLISTIPFAAVGKDEKSALQALDKLLRETVNKPSFILIPTGTPEHFHCYRYRDGEVLFDRTLPLKRFEQTLKPHFRGELKNPRISIPHEVFVLEALTP